MTSSFTTGAATDSKPDSCFFYGTLMFPAIVTRLLGRSASELDFSEAILPGFVRLHIKERDYPALVTLEDANKTFGNLGEDSVKGVLVKGLTSAEMDLLDEWEGDEYFKTTTEVTNSSGEKKKAWIYQWGPEWMSMLLPRVWHFDAFVRDKLPQWSSTDDAAFDSYTFGEIDELRAQRDQASSAPFPNDNIA